MVLDSLTSDNIPAHYIKDSSTITARAAYALNADRRWAVTGTLIQNRLSELCSLLRFLQIYPYSDKEAFDEDIANLWSSGREEEAFSRLKKLLKFIMLRRSDKILHLPKRTDQRLLLEFDSDEQRCYNRAKEVAICALDDILGAGNPGNGYTNVLSKVNRLRMICNLGTSTESDSVCTASRSLPPLDVFCEDLVWNAEAAGKALDEFTHLGMTMTCTNCRSDNSSTVRTYCLLGDELVDGHRPFVVLTKCLRLWCAPCVAEARIDVSFAEYCTCTPRCPYERVELSSSPATPLSSQPSFSATQYSTKIRALVNDLNQWSQTTKW